MYSVKPSKAKAVDGMRDWVSRIVGWEEVSLPKDFSLIH